MYMQNDIAPAADTGFHFKKPRVDPAARQVELEAVIAIANDMRARVRRFDRFEPFSIAPARDDDDYDYFAQIRAIPSSRFGDCEFRFNVPARNTGEKDPVVLAEKLLMHAIAFTGLTGVAKFARVARASIEKTIEPATHGLNPVRLVALGLTVDTSGEVISVVADLETLGWNLQPGIDRVVSNDTDDLGERIAKRVEEHVARQRLRNLIVASRAIGWIDDAALMILDASGLGRAEAYALLRERRNIEFYFDDDQGNLTQAGLFWEDGIIRGEVDKIGGNWRFGLDVLTMQNPGLPETVLTAWAGRRFGDVAEHPFIPANSLVTHVETSGEWVYVRLTTALSLIEDRVEWESGDASSN